MADYGLPDPLLSQIQGGFAPAPSLAQPPPDVAPPMDTTALHPAILSYLTGQPSPMGDGSVHPSAFGDGSVHNLGAAPIAPTVTGGPQAAPEVADTVPSVTGGALPTEPTSLTPPPQQPDIPTANPMPSAADVQQRAAQDAAVKKQAAAQAAFAASPEGQAQRADQIKMQAVNQGQQAINDELAGTEAQNTAVSNALADSQKRQAQQAQIAAQKQTQDEAAKQKLTQQWGQQVQDAANYKVNDDRSVGLGGLIAIALSGIGDALDHRHGPNAAAQIIDAGIQKRIDDQYRQKQALYNKAGATKSMLDEATGQVVDDRTQQQLDLAAEHTRVADQIDSIKAQFANPIAKARAEQLSADQRVKAANIVQGAADRQVQNNRAAQEERDRQAQLGLAAQAQKRADDQFAFEKQKWQDMLNAQKNALNAQGKGAQADAIQKQSDNIDQNGIYDPMTGDVMMDPQGQAKMAAAKQLDTQAQTQPDAAAQLHQQADQLRLDAKLNNAYTIKEPGAHKEVTDNVGYNYKLIKGIDQIRGEIAGDPSGFDRSKWQTIKSQWENVKKDYLKAAGSTELSSRSMQAVDALMGPDPGSFSSREASLSKMKSALEGVRGAALDDMQGTLKGHGIKYNVNVVDPLTLPAPVETNESVLKTPLEIPAPNAIESAQGLLALRNAEQMLYSGDPAKQNVAERILQSAQNSSDRTTRDRATRIIDNHMTGGPPILPDPYKYPDYYKKD